MSPMTPFWRTLDEQIDDPAFQERLYNEFPSEIEAITDPVARRTFLKLMGASLALAGVTACTRQPAEKIVPYVRQPEDAIPGKPLFYATAMALGGVATGLLVESHEGRPTKIEGNPLHPGSLGATDVFAQAAVLGLYDPDRSQTLTRTGEIQPWPAFLGEIHAAVTAQQPLKGAGLRILTESVNSPTLAWQLRDLLKRFPSAAWHQWDPASREGARAGAKLAFGDYADAQYRLDRADVIVALDADFLGSGPGGVRYARDFASRRRPEHADRMNRLYAVESMPTSTGAKADHRLALPPSWIEGISWQLAAAVGVAVTMPPARPSGTVIPADASAPHISADMIRKWIEAVSNDLRAHRGASIVIAGDGQPPIVHALAHAMNHALGNDGKTVGYTEPIEAQPVDQYQSLRALAADMAAGKVDVLVIVGGNPVYSAPVDLDFAAAMGKVPLRVHLSLYDDETSELCHWQIPEAHFLEAWSDARGYDGTASIVQPLIAPLYGGKSAHELLAAMSDRPERSGYDIVREFWSASAAGTPERESLRSSARSGERAGGGAPASGVINDWNRWLHDGVIPGTAYAVKNVGPSKLGPYEPESSKSAIRNPQSGIRDPQSEIPNGLEIVFRNDPCVLDGRFANNGWLQELPKPITRLTWDNAVLVSPATLTRLNGRNTPAFQGGEHGQILSDIVELRYRGRTVRGAMFAVAGHPDDCVTVHTGYGRRRAGHLGTGPGFNANAIRTSDAPWFGGGLEVAATGATYSLACTQYHHLMEGRGMVRAVTRDEFIRDPKSVKEGDETPPKIITLYPDVAYEGHKWGMAIDVNSCIGCNAVGSPGTELEFAL